MKYNIRLKDKIRIDGIIYKQIEATIININKGDLVLDTKDSCYGYIDMKSINKVAIRHGCIVEVGVPISRVRKLIPDINPNQTN